MKKILKIAGGFIAAIILLVFLFGGGEDAYVEHQMQKAENQVAQDAVRQYEIAKANGSAIDAYGAAGFVCAAYLQAKDEENYKKWKQIEQAEAKRAGVLFE